MKVIKALCVDLVLGAQGCCIADVFTATFDEFSEGFYSNTITSGGVHLFDIDQNLGGGDNFTVEMGNSSQLGSWLTPPNACGFGGYVPGYGIGFGRFKSCKFDLTAGGYELRSASLDFWSFNPTEYRYNFITLEGWFNGQLLNSVSYTPGSWVIDHVRLALPDDNYDVFVLQSSGPYDNGVMFALMDNVAVTARGTQDEYYHPNAAVVLKGTYNSGSVGSLGADDDDYWVQGSAYDAVDPLAVINSTLQADTNAASSNYNSGTARAVEKTTTTNAKYRLRAVKAAGGYAVLADNIPAGFTETTVQGVLPAPVSQFIDSANGNRLRLEIRAASSNRLAGFFRHSIDLVEWGLTP